MKVGFDISQLAFSGGVPTHTANLAEKLSREKSVEMKFFYSSLRKPYKGELKPVYRFKLPPTFTENFFNRLRMVTIEKFIGDIDIFHSSDWIQPPTKAKKVTTYHDIVPLKYPQWSVPKIVAVHKRRLEIVQREIDMVIAVSHSTKKDLLEVSSIPEEKIIVVYEGVDEKFVPQKEEKIKEFKMKYNLPENFILCIGGIGERRNLKRVKDVTSDYHLVITGETIPRVPDEEMPLLYASADLLLYPSLYEGFGLPIVESMACGVPVITSNISSMPEVGGDAALYVDPLNKEDIKRKVDLLINDKILKKELIKKGFVQASKFSWDSCAKETIEVYKNVIEEDKL